MELSDGVPDGSHFSNHAINAGIVLSKLNEYLPSTFFIAHGMDLVDPEGEIVTNDGLSFQFCLSSFGQYLYTYSLPSYPETKTRGLRTQSRALPLAGPIPCTVSLLYFSQTHILFDDPTSRDREEYMTNDANILCRT